MRGKVDTFDWAERLARITPAYAGKSNSVTTFSDREQDHPRLCGEKPFRCTVHVLYYGSPPPMRGKAEKDLAESELLRITPAYAGKRADRRRCPDPAQDHPRLCGEKAVRLSCRLCNPGSPPPMRGKVKVLLVEFVVRGITPAYAGKRYPS